MRWIVALGWVVASTSCNAILGIDNDKFPVVDAPDIGDGTDAMLIGDLDDDGIDDSQDPCIAPVDEALGDHDGDALQNGADPCPLDLANSDADDDQLGDRCDAFPSTAGGARRCTLMFSSVSLNGLLWRDVRDVDPTWVADAGALVHAPGVHRTSTTLAERSIVDGEVWSLDAHVEIDVADPIGAFALWLAAWEEEADQAAGYGCQIGDANGVLTLSATGGGPNQQGVAIAENPGDTIRIRVRSTMVGSPSQRRIDCAARLAGESSWTQVSAELVPFANPGRPGFGAFEWPVRVTALDITRHDN